MQVIPAVDVLEGRVVRLRRGRFHESTVYGHDPVGVARSWARQGASLIHVVDLEGARTGKHPVPLARALSEAAVRFQLGGGVRDPEVAEAIISAGADRVIVSTAAIENPNSVGAFIDAVGAEGVVVALDVRAGKAVGSGWLDAGRALMDLLAVVVKNGIQRVLVTGIARDGTMRGPDLSLLDRVHRRCPGLRLIASGGVGRLEDIAAVRDAGAEAVVVGRALYEGRFTLEEALAAGE